MASRMPLLRNLTRIAVALLGVVLIAFGAFVIIRSAGELLIPLILGGVAVAVAIQWPRVALALALVPAILFEDIGGSGILSLGSGFYDQSRLLSPIEMTFVLLVLSTATTIVARRRFVTPGPLTAPLLVGFAALLVGSIVGHQQGVPVAELHEDVRPFVVFLLMPFIVVNILEGREDLRRFLLVVAGLVGVKAAIGVIGVVIGAGALDAEGTPVSYMAPTANWLCLSLLLYLAASAIDRKRPPWMLIGIGALSLVSLLLSYRRSFWLAAIAGLLVVFLAAGSRGWRVITPVVGIVAAIALLLSLSGGISGLSGPLAERVESLQPNRVNTNVEDRYRIDERRNVLADIGEQPLAGIGIGVAWTARYPLSVDRSSSRDYVHFTALWWWLKLGLLGLVSYVWLMVAGAWAAYRVWREQRDETLRLAGLAGVGAVVAIALVETTASFTGVTFRFSIVFGAALGFFVAALAEARNMSGERS